MSGEREALAEVLLRAEHAPMETHDPRTGECLECPWPVHRLPPAEMADAILGSDWLAERDRRVRAEALREAAEEADRVGHHWSGAPALAFFALAGDLRDRADREQP